MPQVFLSHSKRDTAILDFFDRIFSRERVASTAMEFESLRTSPGNEIWSKIEESDALFLLMGPNLVFSQFTENWVGFEVGLATALSKPMFVFEPINASVNFPVPHLDHYMLYSMEEDQYFDYIRGLIHQFTLFPIVRNFTTTFHIVCPYPDCKSSYYLHNRIETFNCPTCRRPVQLGEQPEPPRG